MAALFGQADRVSALFVALLLLFLQWRGGIGVSALTVGATVAFAYVTLALGRVLLAPLAERTDEPSAAWVVGLLASSASVYLLTALLPITAMTAFGALAVIAAGLDIRLRQRIAWHPDGTSLAGFMLCVLLTAAWCAAPAFAYETLLTQGFLPVWSDYFFHGGIISQFGDIRAASHGSIYLANYPPTFYHFASYGDAAALARALDEPGLPVALTAWLPLGFLAMLCGAWMLGARLAGRAGGVAAVAALAILPDASNYGLRNGYLSFHWTLFAHAGSTYALGGALASLAFLQRYAERRDRAALAASGLLALATFPFRAHIFFMYLPMWIATALLSSVPGHRRRATVWATLSGLALAAAGVSALLPYLPGESWRFGDLALPRFLWIVHTGQEPTAYPDVYADLVSLDSPLFTLGAGIVLVIVAALGAFTVLLPAGVAAARAVGRLVPFDIACGYAFFCWLLLLLFAPQPWHTDPTDLIHRPLVLLYAVVAIWTVSLALRLLPPRAAQSRRLWIGLFAASLLAVPAMFATAPTAIQPKFRWGAKDAAVRVPHEIVQAARFLRENVVPGDVFAVAGLNAEYRPFDLAMQISSLSGVPTYLSRPYLEMIKDAPRKRVVAGRLAALQAIGDLDDYGAAMRTLQRLGVGWYLVPGSAGPRWDPQRTRAAFAPPGIAVYAARHPASGDALHDQMRVRQAQQIVPDETAHFAEFRASQALVAVARAHVTAPIE